MICPKSEMHEEKNLKQKMRGGHIFQNFIVIYTKKDWTILLV